MLTCNNYKEELQSFFEETYIKTKWILDKEMKIYVRKSQRYIEFQRFTSLDIATVEVYDEEKRGKGLFKTFIKYVSEVNPYDIVYMENVGGDFLNYFKPNWYVHEYNSVENICECFYLPTEVLFKLTHDN